MHIRQPLLLTGLLALMLSGCISLEFTQKVERNGDSVITETMDLSALLSAGGEYSLGESDLSGACANLTAQEPGLNCTAEGGIVTLSKRISAAEGGYLFNRTSEFPYAIYTLEIHRVPQFVESSSMTSASADALDSDFESPSARMAANTLRAAGASVKYSVEMPGEIISAENGEMVAGEGGRMRAEYDIVSLMSEGKFIVVRSREYDVAMLALAAGAAALLIGGLVVAFVLLKAMKR